MEFSCWALKTIREVMGVGFCNIYWYWHVGESIYMFHGNSRGSFIHFCLNSQEIIQPDFCIKFQSFAQLSLVHFLWSCSLYHGCYEKAFSPCSALIKMNKISFPNLFFCNFHCSFLFLFQRGAEIMQFESFFWPLRLRLHAESIVRYPEDDHHVSLFSSYSFQKKRELGPKKLTIVQTHIICVDDFQKDEKLTKEKISKMIAQKRDKLWNFAPLFSAIPVR